MTTRHTPQEVTIRQVLVDYEKQMNWIESASDDTAVAVVSMSTGDPTFLRFTNEDLGRFNLLGLCYNAKFFNDTVRAENLCAQINENLNKNNDNNPFVFKTMPQAEVKKMLEPILKRNIAYFEEHLSKLILRTLRKSN
ncbi:hypothetical protein AB4254_11055 [Vibrio breoganii]